MTGNNEQKIKHLISKAPQNTVLTTAWLKSQGISNKLCWWYLKAGWFKRISDGAYYFTHSKITWVSAISAIQQQKTMLHPGGRTALQLLGKTHFIHKQTSTIQLITASETKIPKWLLSQFWNDVFQITRCNLFQEKNKSDLTPIEVEGQSILVSSPERAAIETCQLTPKQNTFSETALMIEGLNRLRPKVLQKLLENCHSYKAKRLLLFLGDHFQHSWMSEIDINKLDLGKGKRVIAGGGHYNSKYKISVPILGNTNEH